VNPKRRKQTHLQGPFIIGQSIGDDKSVILEQRAVADGKRWSKKTYNNAISILRRAFEFGYRNHPEQHDPARSLRNARLKKKDRSKIDPFCMQDAETLIAAIHGDWGEAQGNHDEFLDRAPLGPPPFAPPALPPILRSCSPASPLL
jgi:integrase